MEISCTRRIQWAVIPRKNIFHYQALWCACKTTQYTERKKAEIN